MSEMSFEQMLEESLKTIRNGEVVEGTVIDVKPDEIILNIGYKSDGIITRNEYTNEPNVDLTTVVKAGDTLEAKVVKVNDGEGQVLLSYKRLAAVKSLSAFFCSVASLDSSLSLSKTCLPVFILYSATSEVSFIRSS